MTGAIKNKRLAEFCKRAAIAADELGEIISGFADEMPQNTIHQLEVLRGRLRRPEVRNLILGPLKSGKSTLMNLLAENPRVSQINQLPAYPCVVEVQDIDREENIGPEESIFYKNGTPEKPIPLQKGIEKLDALLYDYIRDGENAAVKYDKVVQKVDLRLTHEDLNLVLIDSPGVMFGKEGYSEETQRLLTESDVVIFVIRPEQLFFKIIKEYLRNFVQNAASRRVFILVNASTQAKTQKNGVWVDCDQVEMKNELLEYFYKHIAGTELNAELRTEVNISVHFADLFVASAALLGGDAKSHALYTPESDTRLCVERIQKYIRHEDLAAKKERNIQTLFVEIVKSAKDFLAKKEEDTTTEIQTVEVQIKEQQKVVMVHTKERDDHKAEIEESKHKLDGVGARLAKLTDNPDDITGLEATVTAFCKYNASELMIPDEMQLREQCEKIYDRWKEGRLGTRSLEMLWRVVWTTRVLENRESFEDQYKSIVNDIYQNGLTKAREAAPDEDLQHALLCQEMSKTLRNSPLSTRTQLPLLEFPKKRTIFPPHLIGYTATDLWGKDRKCVLNSKFEFGILDENRDTIISQILHAPWAIKDHFSLQCLSTVAKNEFIHRVKPLLKTKLSEHCGALQQNAAQMEKAHAIIIDRLVQKQKEKEETEKHLHNCQHRIVALRSRQTQLDEAQSKFNCNMH